MRAAVLLSVLVAGCDPGCRAPPAAPPATDVLAPQREVPARCVEEVRAASVVFPPGSGDVDALSVACHEGTLGVFALRGHVLSWTARRDRAVREILSGAKAAPGASEQHRPNRVIGLGRCQRIGEFSVHRRGKAVQPVRPRQRYQRDAIGAHITYRLIAHLASS